ncbi:hypothetical protein EGP99_02880, partial [bacterium]|nr:hypothetical protein [bacterium]
NIPVINIITPKNELFVVKPIIIDTIHTNEGIDTCFIFLFFIFNLLPLIKVEKPNVKLIISLKSKKI